MSFDWRPHMVGFVILCREGDDIRAHYYLKFLENIEREQRLWE